MHQAVWRQDFSPEGATACSHGRERVSPWIVNQPILLSLEGATVGFGCVADNFLFEKTVASAKTATNQHLLTLTDLLDVSTRSEFYDDALKGSLRRRRGQLLRSVRER